MPPVMRIKRLRQYTATMGRIKIAMAHAEAASDLSAFHSALESIPAVASSIGSLADDARIASDGYTSLGRVRRALWQAAQQLDSLETSLTQLYLEGQEFTHPSEIKSSKFVMRLLGLQLAGNEIRFSPPIEKPSRASIMEMLHNSDDVLPPADSQMNKGEAGSLGDAQLDAVRHMLDKPEG